MCFRCFWAAFSLLLRACEGFAKVIESAGTGPQAGIWFGCEGFAEGSRKQFPPEGELKGEQPGVGAAGDGKATR